MIKCHKLIDDSNFKILIEDEIRSVDISGYISRDTLKQFFNLFSWVYIEGSVDKAFIKDNTKLEKFLERFDLYRFKGDSLCYSAVLFYQKLSKVLDLRALEEGDVVPSNTGSNKLFAGESFKYKDLYDMYIQNAGDLSTDFLLFDTLFKKKDEKIVSKIKNYGDIVRPSTISSLVRPDLPYKIATKQLDVNHILETSEEAVRKIYILQDCTLSMDKYKSHLKTIKAFILNAAFKFDYAVEWLYISNRINERVTYNKENIHTADIEFNLYGSKVDTSNILVTDEFLDKQVVIITDGTDTFNFPFNTKTKDIHVISFLDNINIKNKISNYGKFFRVKLS